MTILALIRYAWATKIGKAVIIAAVLIIAFVIWLKIHDRGVVKNDRATANAEASQRKIAADEAAGNAQSARDTDIRDQQRTQEEQAHEARRNRRSALDDLHNGL